MCARQCASLGPPPTAKTLRCGDSRQRLHQAREKGVVILFRTESGHHSHDKVPGTKNKLRFCRAALRSAGCRKARNVYAVVDGDDARRRNSVPGDAVVRIASATTMHASKRNRRRRFTKKCHGRRNSPCRVCWRSNDGNRRAAQSKARSYPLSGAWSAPGDSARCGQAERRHAWTIACRPYSRPTRRLMIGTPRARNSSSSPVRSEVEGDNSAGEFALRQARNRTVSVFLGAAGAMEIIDDEKDLDPRGRRSDFARWQILFLGRWCDAAQCGYVHILTPTP